MDPLGNGDGGRWNNRVGDHCVCASLKREGSSYFNSLPGIHVLNIFTRQREDELERRRASHHINFDAL